MLLTVTSTESQIILRACHALWLILLKMKVTVCSDQISLFFRSLPMPKTPMPTLVPQRGGCKHPDLHWVVRGKSVFSGCPLQEKGSGAGNSKRQCCPPSLEPLLGINYI